MMAGSQVSSITNIATAEQERLVIMGAAGVVGAASLTLLVTTPLGVAMVHGQ
jgi:hypothetical protein